MSMDHMVDAMKLHTDNLIDARGQFKIGIVKSVDPGTYNVKCEIQPDGVMSGWLPVFSLWVGNGWGISALPPPGTQVLIAPAYGDMEHGMVIGALFSSVDQPPGTPRVGELLIKHDTGTFLRLANDGKVHAKAEYFVLEGDIGLNGNLWIDKDLMVMGKIHSMETITASGPILPASSPSFTLPNPGTPTS